MVALVSTHEPAPRSRAALPKPRITAGISRGKPQEPDLPPLPLPLVERSASVKSECQPEVW